MNTVIQQGCIKLIKSDSKHIYNVTKDLYFKQMLFFFYFLFLSQKKVTVSIKILSSIMVFNIDNNKKCFLKSANQHIIMIYEGSCNTEDNDAENSALHHRNKLHFKFKNVRVILNCNNFSQYYSILYF